MWRDRDFRLFYGGQAVSLTGSAVSRVALPLLGALTLHSGPLGIAMLQACGWLPYLGLPLLVGVYVDRHRRRPVLILANAVQAVLLGLVPLLASAGLLNLPTACAIALGSGVGAVYFAVAEVAYLPDLVGRDRLLPATAAIEAARSASVVFGRGLAGLVVQAVGAPLAVLADAVSYLVSVVTLVAIRAPEPAPPPAEGRNTLADLTAGLRFVYGSRILRGVTVWVLLSNAASQAFSVPFLLYAVRERHVGTALWGVVLAATGVTGLVGAALAPRIAGRFGYGPAVVVSGVLAGAPMIAVPLASGPVPVVVAVWLGAQAVSGFGAGTVNVLLSTLRTQVTPPALLGRVAAATRQVAFGAIPLGALAGGALAGSVGNRPALWLLIALMIVANTVLVPVWRLRTLHAWQVLESSSSAA